MGKSRARRTYHDDELEDWLRRFAYQCAELERAGRTPNDGLVLDPGAYGWKSAIQRAGLRMVRATYGDIRERAFNDMESERERG